MIDTVRDTRIIKPVLSIRLYFFTLLVYCFMAMSLSDVGPKYELPASFCKTPLFSNQ